MEENMNATQILKYIYNILDKDYFHVHVSTSIDGKVQWKIYYKCLIHEDYYSEENKLLLSSERNTLEDVERLESIFQKEKNKVEEKIFLDNLFMVNNMYSVLRILDRKITTIILILYTINLILWLISCFIQYNTTLSLYGTILMWLILISNFVIDKIFDKEISVSVKKNMEEKTRMYIKGMGFKFLERIRIQ